MNIRRAQNNQKDCNLVYNLSNDPEVRANSFNTALIEYSNHVAWYNRTLTDENVLFFLLFEFFDCFICNRQEAGMFFVDDFEHHTREELAQLLAADPSPVILHEGVCRYLGL